MSSTIAVEAAPAKLGEALEEALESAEISRKGERDLAAAAAQATAKLAGMISGRERVSVSIVVHDDPDAEGFNGRLASVTVSRVDPAAAEQRREEEAAELERRETEAAPLREQAERRRSDAAEIRDQVAELRSELEGIADRDEDDEAAEALDRQAGGLEAAAGDADREADELAERAAAILEGRAPEIDDVVVDGGPPRPA